NIGCPVKHLRDRIDEPLRVTRRMPLHRGSNRRHKVQRPAMLREKNLNARTCGLYRFDKDQFVFARNDHGALAAASCFWQHVENCRGGKLRTQAGDYSLPERFGEGAEACTFATANPSCGG